MAPSAAARSPDITHTQKLTRLHGVLRRLQELVFKIKRYYSSTITSLDLEESEAAFKRIKRGLTGTSVQVPDHWQQCCLDKLVTDVTLSIKQIDQQNRIARVRAWRKKLRESFDIHGHGAAAYQWLRSNSTQAIRAVAAKDGSIATGTCAVLEERMSQALFNKDKLVFVSEFLPKVKHLLPTSPCEVPQVSGAQIRAIIADVNNKRAIVLDGWRIPELKALPGTFFGITAQVFHEVEHGMPWLTACTLGVISTIPKDSGVTGDQAEVGQPIAGDGLSTRPITNLSPLYAAYSSMRFKHMEAWRESWLSDCMAGARKGYEVFDNSWPLSLALENSHLNQLHCAGVSMNRKKFFDLLEYDIGLCILSVLGAPVTGHPKSGPPFG